MPKATLKLRKKTSVRSKTQQAYIAIKDMILRLDLLPGFRVREDELEVRLRIGRTPLREALQRLSHEGFLQIFPRRLIVVAKFGIEEVRQVHEARSLLEPAAAGLAARHFTHASDADVHALEGHKMNEHSLVNVADFLARNLAFHQSVARLAGNVFLQDDIEHVLTLNHWLWNLSYRARGIRQVYPPDHNPVIEAIRNGDMPAAEEAMRQDVFSSRADLLPGLR